MERRGEGEAAGWVWSICLRNTLKKKSVPLTKISLHLRLPAWQRDQRALFKNRGTKQSQKLPDVSKASHTQSPPSSTARHPALLVAGSRRRKTETRGSSGRWEWLLGERSSSTGSAASAPPFCLSHMGYFLMEHGKNLFIEKKKKPTTILED